MQGRNWDSTTPVGPFLVTADAVGGPCTSPFSAFAVARIAGLRDQLTHQATRPQLAMKTQVTRQVIQNRLPHRCLLDVGQHLMLTHAPPTRTRGQRLAPAHLPLRPPAVHRLE
ncbi:hypothetical protein [Streptomyces sp. NPDC001450]